jgi:hypothetical protein
LTFIGQGIARLLSGLGQELMGHAHEDAGPIAAVGVAAAGSPVIEIDENFQGILHRLVRGPPFHIHNKTDPAGIVLIGGVIESLLGRVRVSAIVL